MAGQVSMILLDLNYYNAQVDDWIVLYNVRMISCLGDESSMHA